jgi:hypothetical protein
MRTGVIFSRIATTAVHSGVVNRSGSKYAGEQRQQPAALQGGVHLQDEVLTGTPVPVIQLHLVPGV